LSKLLLITLLLMVPVTVLAGGPPSQVLVEVGLAIPYGDLNDNFEDTEKGFGADNGYVAGFRYRLHLSDSFSISPSFHFVDFKNFNGVHPDVDEYRIACTSLRYAVEFMVMSPPGGARPFLALGVGISHNRVQGYYQDFVRAIDESVNSVAWTFRGGLQVGGFELSLVYNLDRFNTWHFHESYNRDRYNWDALGMRAGWIIPFE
jgi:hypothetical protein